MTVKQRIIRHFQKGLIQLSLWLLAVPLSLAHQVTSSLEWAKTMLQMEALKQ